MNINNVDQTFVPPKGGLARLRTRIEREERTAAQLESGCAKAAMVLAIAIFSWVGVDHVHVRNRWDGQSTLHGSSIAATLIPAGGAHGVRIYWAFQ